MNFLKHSTVTRFFKTKGQNLSGYYLGNNEWNGLKILTTVRLEYGGDSTSFFLSG